MVEVMNFAFFISHVLKKGGHNRKEVAYARSYSKIVVLGMQLDMWVRKHRLDKTIEDKDNKYWRDKLGMVG